MNAVHGVNIVGHFTAPSGVGEIARLLARTLEENSTPHTVVGDRARPSGTATLYDTTVVCVNPDSLPRIVNAVPADLFSGRRSVGFWWWEVERFPRHWRWATQLFDELWVGSEYVQAALEPVVDLPVHVFPVPVPKPQPVASDRTRFGLPTQFLFFFSFNYESIFARKNPLGLIEAFRAAFIDRTDVALVIHATNGSGHTAERRQLIEAADVDPRIILMEERLSPDDYESLYEVCDAYVSLHRAEGFGLTIARAMARGKPTVATGYSGNLEFMDPEYTYLVPFTLEAIPDGLPYAAGATWAAPDIDVAARMMREIVDDPEQARRLAVRARDRLLHEHSFERAARFVDERFASLPPSSSVANDGFASVARRLLRGPDLRSTRRSVQWARRAARPFFRPHVDYQVEVTQRLLEAIDARFAAIEQRLERVEDRLSARRD